MDGVWRGEARERAHLKIEWSARNCSRPRAGGREKRIFVARAMASGIRLLNVFIALERVRTYTQPCKRASRTFAFESCATYINWLSFSSIVVRFLPVSFHRRKCSFVLPSRVSFFTFLATNQLSNGMIIYSKSILTGGWDRIVTICFEIKWKYSGSVTTTMILLLCREKTRVCGTSR